MPPPNAPSSLESALRQAAAARPPYAPRTRHKDAAGRPRFINRLILEDSPYLLQHAHNPVDWFPWGGEAFAEARRRGLPLFLSIGYSTCHWCHVMEEESFDNEEVAGLLNRGFVSIKMDREQYPDLDELYMTGVQLLTGQGGWPMSNFLLADGRAFHGGTYYPPPMFMHLLRSIDGAWRERRGELEDAAARLGAAVGRVLGEGGRGDGGGADAGDSGGAAGGPIKEGGPLADDGLNDDLVNTLLAREDRRHGGLAGAPKFPQEPILLGLLALAARQPGQHDSLPAYGFVQRALNGMAAGGIYDQVGGGFHRYSVDAQWLVPHFEKMLYNQSQLGLVYLQAWALSGDRFFRRVCEQTLDYVLRDMQAAEGGFFSATDADSEAGDEEDLSNRSPLEGEPMKQGRSPQLNGWGERRLVTAHTPSKEKPGKDADNESGEGLFFLWSEAELQRLLTAEEFALLQSLYDITAEGNFEGTNILSLHHPLRITADSDLKPLDGVLQKLYRRREKRRKPLRDEKIITAWCGAMIHTLAQASSLMHRPDWLEAAERAARRLLDKSLQRDKSPQRDKSRDKDFRLHRILLHGASSIDGRLEDYTNFAQGLISLFDATGKADYLQAAAALTRQALTQFHDAETHTVYLGPTVSCDGSPDDSHSTSRSDSHSTVCLTRPSNAADGATLSPVATLLDNLLQLSRRPALLADGEPAKWLSLFDTIATKLLADSYGNPGTNPISHISLHRVLADRRHPTPHLFLSSTAL